MPFTLFYGCMFASKTTHLIDSATKAVGEFNEVLVVKHNIDNRYSLSHLVAHNKKEVPCIAIQNALSIIELLKPETNTIVIDEIQFFDKDIIPVIHSLLEKGMQVYAAGLDLDSNGKYFKMMPELLEIADQKVRLFATCNCGAKATKSFRKSANKSLILAGHADLYEPKCDSCFYDSLT